MRNERFQVHQGPLILKYWSQECISFNKLMKSEVYKSHFLIKSTEKAKLDDVRIIVRLTFKTKPDKVVFPEQI